MGLCAFGVSTLALGKSAPGTVAKVTRSHLSHQLHISELSEGWVAGNMDKFRLGKWTLSKDMLQATMTQWKLSILFCSGGKPMHGTYPLTESSKKGSPLPNESNR